MQQKKRLSSLLWIGLCLLLTGLLLSCDSGSGIGLEQRNCVVMLGDSIFALSGAETRFLQQMSGHRYRTYYANGAQLEGGMISDIEDQYDRAQRAGKIRTIIMDGGGNDFLMGGCGNLDRLQREIEAAWGRILDKAARDGVENIIVQGYYLTASTPKNSEVSDYDALAEQLEKSGAQRGINLVYVDPNKDSWFSSKRPSQYTITDGIHPTNAASRELARLVWTAMQSNDMEQGEGCQGFR